MSALRLQRGDQAHDEVLNDTAALVTADARVYDVSHLFENFDDRLRHFAKLKIIELIRLKPTITYVVRSRV